MPPRLPLHHPALLALLLGKIGLHLIATRNAYGIHRDEYLYLAEGSHPMWGYMEGPPIIGWVAGISTTIFGSSIWAAKVPVLIIGLVSIYLLLLCVRQLGGGPVAQFLAGLAWLLSPAFLGSNNLFQPVSFNQFCWLLIGWGFLRLVRQPSQRRYLLLGGFVGLALMTKYSVIFYLLALLAGVLLTPQRKLLWRKDALYAVGVASLLFLPNLIWQITYDFPVVDHMRTLAATQLVNVSTTDFLFPQFLFLGAGISVWGPGLLFLLAVIGEKSGKKHTAKTLGFAYLACLLLLLLLSGKAYYTIGAYSILLAAGGVYWERRLKKYALLLVLPLFLNFYLIPYVLPLLPVEKMEAFGQYMKENYYVEAPLRWEDGSYRSLGQDYADMHGWEEMVAKVAEFYHQLSPEEKDRCMIYAGNYGQAGALTFYRQKYDLPEVHSFNASFLLWVPEDVAFDHQIAIEDNPDAESPYFGINQLIDSTRIEYARERQYIYFRSEPTEELKPVWKEIIQRQRANRLGM